MPVQTMIRRERSALVYENPCICGGWNHIVDGFPSHLDYCPRLQEENDFTKQRKYLMTLRDELDVCLKNQKIGRLTALKEVREIVVELGYKPIEITLEAIDAMIAKEKER
jgi:hypothetical protein